MPASSTDDKPWIILGSELSPYTLKVLNYFSYLKIPHRFYYQQGSFIQNIGIQLRKMALVSGLQKLTWPEMSEDDEYPLVPFIFGPDGENMYDSSAVANWLDNNKQGKLVPGTDPRLAFLIQMIDEYADEMGLYMVHHNRWKVAAIDNDAGARLGKEISSVVGPMGVLVDQYFSARQTRRLPYLFSVAPENFKIEGLPKRRQPPSRKGFPETHNLLEDAFDRLLSALEPIFTQRPYLFGNCYTLADASIYGQLAMNLSDPAAAKLIQRKAPATYQWLQRLSQLEFSDLPPAEPQWFDDLQPLLNEITRTFLPLMQQNARAVEHCKKSGQKVFNEAAFNKGQALYTGEIDGINFKSVAKTFQSKVWKELINKFHQLSSVDQDWIDQHCKFKTFV